MPRPFQHRAAARERVRLLRTPRVLAARALALAREARVLGHLLAQPRLEPRDVARDDAVEVGVPAAADRARAQ